MHSLGDDNELDDLSRDAAGMYKTPGAPNWQKMSAELDKVLPVETNRRTGMLWWLVPAVLLIGGGGYWMMQSSHEPEAINANPAIANAIKQPAAVTVQDPAKIAKGNTPVTPAAPAEDTHNAITFYRRESNLTQPRSQKNHAAVNTGRSAVEVPAKTRAAPAVTTAAGPTISVTGQEKTATSKMDKVEKVTREPDQPKIIVESNTGQPAQAITAKETKDEPQTATENRVSHWQDKITPAPFGKGWSIGFVAGVDKSTVKFRYGNEPGYNLGILAGYHINSHLSLHAGAIFTQKNYKMAGEDFTAPKGSAPSYYKLENVAGYCRMWDIPLLARYTFSPKGNNNFYLSAGLSSYFMTTENYNYFYYYQGTPVTRNINYASDDTHVLSILHISGGFETRMSNNTSLQIEPYAKLPMGGVGLGNIRLSSFGINAILQLRQPAKK